MVATATKRHAQKIVRTLRKGYPDVSCALRHENEFQLLIATILLFPAWVRGQVELRRKNKALLELEADLEQLRRSMERGTPHRGNVGERDRFEDVAND